MVDFAWGSVARSIGVSRYTCRHTSTSIIQLSLSLSSAAITANQGIYWVDHEQLLSSYTQSSLVNAGHIRHCFVRQVALLWQRDHATRLSVEILQLKYPYRMALFAWSYVQPFLHNTGVWQTHTQRDGRTDTRRRHVMR